MGTFCTDAGLIWMYKSMEPEEAVKHSSSPTFLLRFGRSGGSGHGRSPSGSVPPAWWGHWSAPDTGDSWQSAAPTCVVSSPASTEAQVRKWTWALVSPPFALLCLFLKDRPVLAQRCISRFVPENSDMKTNTVTQRESWTECFGCWSKKQPAREILLKYVKLII